MLAACCMTSVLNAVYQSVSFQTIGHYYPLEAGSLTFGPFTIDMVTADESNPSFTVRDFTITYSKRVSRLY